jgi:hypothetical protein
MWSHTIIICKRNKPSPEYFTDIFWSFKMKFPSPIVLVYPKTSDEGTQSRPSFIILNFPLHTLFFRGGVIKNKILKYISNVTLLQSYKTLQHTTKVTLLNFSDHLEQK